MRPTIWPAQLTVAAATLVLHIGVVLLEASAQRIRSIFLAPMSCFERFGLLSDRGLHGIVVDRSKQDF
jgi:hypothetical protein